MEENEILEIQSKINTKLDQIKTYTKELNDMKLKNDKIKLEINKKLENIQELQKIIGEKKIKK